MMGPISYVKQDECIVTNVTSFYTRCDPPPRLIWGKNIKRMSESRKPSGAQGYRAPIVLFRSRARPSRRCGRRYGDEKGAPEGGETAEGLAGEDRATAVAAATRRKPPAPPDP